MENGPKGEEHLQEGCLEGGGTPRGRKVTSGNRSPRNRVPMGRGSVEKGVPGNPRTQSLTSAAQSSAGTPWSVMAACSLPLSVLHQGSDTVCGPPQPAHRGWALCGPWLCAPPRSGCGCAVCSSSVTTHATAPVMLPGVPRSPGNTQKWLLVTSEKVLLESGCSMSSSLLPGGLQLHLHLLGSGRNQRGELETPWSLLLMLGIFSWAVRSCSG